MAKDVLKVTDPDFRREVLESTQPVLVDFGADWCPPCRAIEPAVSQLASRYKGQVKVAQVNVDESQVTAHQYAIRSLPTFLVFKGGRVVAQMVGAAPLAKIEALVQRGIAA